MLASRDQILALTCGASDPDDERSRWRRGAGRVMRILQGCCSGELRALPEDRLKELNPEHRRLTFSSELQGSVDVTCSR